SDKYHCDTLKQLYTHIIIKHTATASNIKAITQQVQSLIDESKLNKQKQTALEIANLLQKNPGYHQLLKMNHFLIIYLTYGGFSEESIHKIKNNLLLEDISEHFASFAKDPNFSLLFPEVH